MTLNGTFEGNSLKIELMQKGSLLMLAVMASLVLAFRHHNGIMLGAVTALAMVVVPAGYVLTLGVIAKLRQHETEDRLMMHTRTYLRNEKPSSAAGASDIGILACAIEGRKLQIEDFRMFQEIASRLPVGDPVIFGALPGRYAMRSLYEQRWADLAAMPKIASVPLGELLPVPATQEFES